MKLMGNGIIIMNTAIKAVPHDCLASTLMTLLLWICVGTVHCNYNVETEVNFYRRYPGLELTSNR